MSVRFRCARGEFVYQQGEQAARLYRAETGLLRLARTTGRGRTVTVRHVLPGDYFGEDALQGAVRAQGAEALTNATITRFEAADLDGDTLLDLTRNLGEQLRRAMMHEVHLQSGDLRQRLVRYLLELADTPLGAEDAENHLYVRATHELLAEGSGSTRESVSKIITDLRSEALIESGYRHVTLLDLEGLRTIAAPATASGEEVQA
ncbi:helix-turn-helix domain-containing protein [Deinococcus maricopensis]|uniref:Transcriptional regulator, Crp/Fnr family n=1 Tax=Deinococcus maricopensis (strain DSM 21211 / LMG 22137 / NRRL B-23946 / LB-34) TaxID=709986 RepID=E8UAM4_DEIML|nr:helix-turn-helix domain-containing protein [Deinococcus maricopensis]ADV68113.1 transcriptional regulator, Crp/Fnr family [Deinococcus maricopensis DSM 21211]